ncbi:hypothetical protein EDB19DRAFT_1647257 [Suillus lakei]|nr:hypothetical protein EDB19DRAFT_1647257 [Suillus lakei]
MKRVLDVLQDSTIASRSGKDSRSRFWGVYKRVAEEHDGEFLERYTSDMDIVLVFSGLFSAVSTSFIVAMEPNLSPNPSDTTNALLTQLVDIGLGNLAAAGSVPAAPASMWSPLTTTIWIQKIAYASLSMSLLAAFGAVLGKQWLGYYKSNRYGRGSQEERGKAQARDIRRPHHMVFRCCCAIISSLTSDLPTSLWDRPQCQYVDRAAEHRLGHHCNDRSSDFCSIR